MCTEPPNEGPKRNRALSKLTISGICYNNSKANSVKQIYTKQTNKQTSILQKLLALLKQKEQAQAEILTRKS